MRNTARKQVIALALLGAMAWISIQSGAVQSAVAGFLGSTTVERGVEASPGDSSFRAPVLATPDVGPSGFEGRRRHRHPLVIPVHAQPVRHAPSSHIWVVRHAKEAFVG